MLIFHYQGFPELMENKAECVFIVHIVGSVCGICMITISIIHAGNV